MHTPTEGLDGGSAAGARVSVSAARHAKRLNGYAAAGTWSLSVLSCMPPQRAQVAALQQAQHVSQCCHACHRRPPQSLRCSRHNMFLSAVMHATAKRPSRCAAAGTTGSHCCHAEGPNGSPAAGARMSLPCLCVEARADDLSAGPGHCRHCRAWTWQPYQASHDLHAKPGSREAS